MSAAGSPPFPPFAVNVVRHGSEVAVAPRGELDLASAAVLTDAVHDLWSGNRDPVLIDLRPLEFIDSSGLRALLVLREEAARAGRDLSLRPGPSVVQRIFDLTGTRGLFRWRSVQAQGRSCPVTERPFPWGIAAGVRRRPGTGASQRLGVLAPRRRHRDPE